MSMIGEYLGVTAAELDRVIQDPDWALDFVEEVQDTKRLGRYPHLFAAGVVRKREGTFDYCS